MGGGGGGGVVDGGGGGGGVAGDCAGRVQVRVGGDPVKRHRYRRLLRPLRAPPRPPHRLRQGNNRLGRIRIDRGITMWVVIRESQCPTRGEW